MPPDSVAHRLSLRPEGRFTVLVCICGVEKVTAELHHDVAHLSLAYAAGMVTSPTLLRVVHDDPSFASDDLVAFEEEAVAAFVQFATAAGR